MGKIRIDTVDTQLGNPGLAFAYNNARYPVAHDLEMPEFTHPLSRLHAEFSHPCRGEEPEFANSGTVVASARASQSGSRATPKPMEQRRVVSIKIERLKDGNAVVHLR